MATTIEGGPITAMAERNVREATRPVCTHGDVWVVDTATQRVVRRPCRACEAEATALSAGAVGGRAE